MPLPLNLTIVLILLSICLVVAFVMAAMLRTPSTRAALSKWMGIAIAAVACFLFVAAAIWSHPSSGQVLNNKGAVQTVFGQVAQLRTENERMMQQMEKEKRTASELLARAEAAEQTNRHAERRFGQSLWKLQTDFANEQHLMQKKLAQIAESVKRDRMQESPNPRPIAPQNNPPQIADDSPKQPPADNDMVPLRQSQHTAGQWVACSTVDWQPYTVQVCKPVCPPVEMVIVEPVPTYYGY